MNVSMKELLFEIYCEEIPALLQKNSAQKLFALAAKHIKKKINIEVCGDFFYTSRRIGFVIYSLPITVKIKTKEIKGPKINAPASAIAGFQKKYINIKGQYLNRNGYLYYCVEALDFSINKFITNIICDVLQNFNWPQSIKWTYQNIKWIRPIHNILCLLDGIILPVRFGNLIANNVTYGNWLIIQKKLYIKSYQDYKNKLKEAGVLIYHQERANLIKKFLLHISQQYNIRPIKNSILLEEISNLVEYPYPIFNIIDRYFVSLPQEILINTLEIHQKYLIAQYKDNTCAPFFFVIANIVNNTSNIIKGNMRVLQARLSDAKFLLEQDKRSSLFTKFNILRTMVYHRNIGTYYEKLRIIKKFAIAISKQMNIFHSNILHTTNLIKIDLVTKMVQEQPNLQGIIGCYCGSHDGEKLAVTDAIKEHYLPQRPKDNTPKKLLSVIIALADKLATLNMMFQVGVTINGSQDPYALRRTTIAVIRIICQNHLNIQLYQLLNANVIQFFRKRIQNFNPLHYGITKKDIMHIKKNI